MRFIQSLKIIYKRYSWRIFLVLILMMLPADNLWSKSLVADLSSYHVTIDTGFSGASLMLFGARVGVGNVIVTTRGPETKYNIYKKSRVGGIWMNMKSEKTESIPKFYHIASSYPVDDIERNEIFKNLRLGYDQLFKDSEFTIALLKRLEEEGLYSKSGKVNFTGETLFSAPINFPDRAPEGQYTVEVYLFNEGALSAVHSIPLFFEKVHLDAFVNKMANKSSVIYGLLAVFIAFLSGWVADRLFNKT